MFWEEYPWFFTCQYTASPGQRLLPSKQLWIPDMGESILSWSCYGDRIRLDVRHKLFRRLSCSGGTQSLVEPGTYTFWR